MTASKTLADLLAPLVALQRLLARFNDQGLVPAVFRSRVCHQSPTQMEPRNLFLRLWHHLHAPAR